MKRDELPPVEDPAIIEKLKKLAATLVQRRTLRMEKIAESEWRVLPLVSACHFDERHAQELSEAFDHLGESNCYAVVAETLKNFPSCFRFPTNPQGFLDFSWTCAHFNFILLPESARCAVLCTTDDYFILAGPEGFVRDACGGDIAEARKKFDDYAKGDRRLEKVAAFYARAEMIICPVCGYELSEPPWSDDSPSDEICPCCGIQFGFDDFAAGKPADRAFVYDRWRNTWKTRGMPWFSPSTRPPEGWNPAAQARRAVAGTKADLGDLVRTTVDVKSSSSSTVVSAGTTGRVNECYTVPCEGYSVDLELPESTLVGGVRFENAVLLPEQFEVVKRAK